MTWWCGMSAAQMLPVAINHAVDVSITLSGPLSPGRRCRAGAAGQPTGAGTIFGGMLAPRVFAGRCMMTWMDEGMQLFGLDQSADHCNHVGYWACVYRRISDCGAGRSTGHLAVSQAKRIQEGTGRGHAHARCTGVWTHKWQQRRKSAAWDSCISVSYVFGPKLLQSTPSRSLSKILKFERTLRITP